MDPFLSAEIDRLLDLLNSSNPGDRRMAAENLGKLGCREERVRLALESVSQQDADSFARSAALYALEELGFALPKPSNQVEQAEFPEVKDVARMVKIIRGWSIYLLFVGGYLLLVSGYYVYQRLSINFDPIWGVLIICVAILALKIKIPVTFILFAVVTGWAAVTNGLAMLWTGRPWLLLIVIVQVIVTVIFVMQYRKYRHLQLQELFQKGKWPANLAQPPDEAALTGKFALVSFILAGVIIILLPLSCIGLLIRGTLVGENAMAAQSLLTGLVQTQAVALGLGLAALLSVNTRRRMAITGVVISALVLIGWVGLNLLIILQGGMGI
jgi:hypothetical protein